MTIWYKVGLVLVGVYLVTLALLYLMQRSLIYPAPDGPVPLPEGFEEHVVETEDGLELRLAYRPARAGQQVVVFFHGNGDSWTGAVLATRTLADAGYGIVLPEYRGYAGNPGSPSETGLYADGRAALEFLRRRGIGPGETILIGNSIGGGVATQLASERGATALILISPFTSLPDLASEKFPWLPVRLLLKDRFDNAAKFPNVDAPILILHGRRDALTPASHGEALAALNRRAAFIGFPQAGHELAYLPAAGEAQRNWLGTLTH